MTDSAKLTLIKILHTLIWIFFNVVICYMLYAVIIDKIDMETRRNNFPISLAFD